MLLKRFDRDGNKFYVNAFTGKAFHPRYVSPLKKSLTSENGSKTDSLIKRLKEEVIYYREKYTERLAKYKARDVSYYREKYTERLAKYKARNEK
jgi:hypothetical protein